MQTSCIIHSAPVSGLMVAVEKSRFTCPWINEDNEAKTMPNTNVFIIEVLVVNCDDNAGSHRRLFLANYLKRMGEDDTTCE